MYSIALIQTLNTGWNFHKLPDSLIDNEEGKNDNTKKSTRVSKDVTDSLKFRMKTLKKIGLKLVEDRTLCFAGRMLRGILMPKNRFLQAIIMRRIFLWYFPCIRVAQNAYRVNNLCFVKKEKKFIKMMKRIAANSWLQSKTLKLFYFQ